MIENTDIMASHLISISSNELLIKNVNIQEYKWATALESLFGYLYLNENNDRIKELIDIIVGD